MNITSYAIQHIAKLCVVALEAINNARNSGEKIIVSSCRECAESLETRSRYPRSRCPKCFGFAHYIGKQARTEVNRAIALGRLIPPSSLRCDDCAGWASEYDHRDYSRPLMVDPVCASCNCLRGPGYLGVSVSNIPVVHTRTIKNSQAALHDDFVAYQYELTQQVFQHSGIDAKH